MSIQEINLPITREAAATDPLRAPARQPVYVAFDTETTGLSPVVGRLVELSGVKFTADGRQLSTFQSLINPCTPIPPGATDVHGITDDMVADEPTFEEVVPKFIKWATDDENHGCETVLIAHNAPFDLGFLETALCKMNLPVPTNLVLDTLPMARALIADAPNYQLRTLVEYLGVGAETYHRALDDSLHVQHIFAKLLTLLPSEATLEDLVAISGKLHFIDRSQPEDHSRWQNMPEFVIIQRTIETGGNLRIEYSGARKSQRIVTPRSVLFARGTPYLTAFCHNAAAERTFRIDRIIRVEALEETP